MWITECRDKIKVGDSIETNGYNNYLANDNWETGDGIITEINDNHFRVENKEKGYDWIVTFLNKKAAIHIIKKKEKKMSKCDSVNVSVNIKRAIANVFKTIEAAELVQKHLGNQIEDNYISELVLEQNKDDVLDEVVKLEEEEKRSK